MASHAVRLFSLHHNMSLACRSTKIEFTSLHRLLTAVTVVIGVDNLYSYCSANPNFIHHMLKFHLYRQMMRKELINLIPMCQLCVCHSFGPAHLIYL